MDEETGQFWQHKKYPVLFYVYILSPGDKLYPDAFGASNNFLYKGDMSKDWLHLRFNR